MAPERSKLVTLGAFVMGVAIVALTGYVFYLATRTSPTTAKGKVAPDDSLQAIGETAQKLLAAGDWTTASRVLGSAVEQYPADVDLRQRYAEVLQNLATGAATPEEGQAHFEQAYAQWVAILELGDRDAAAEFRAGLAASSAKLPRKALEHFERAAVMDAQRPEYALNLGMVQYNLGMFPEARVSLNRAALLKPDLAPAWGMLAQVALRDGNRTVALQSIARARAIDAADPNWRIIEADAATIIDPERAIGLLESLEPALRAREDVLRIARNCYGAKGRFGDAGTFFAAASDLNPRDGSLAMQTADLFARAGARDRAREYAERAREAGDPGAEALLARIDAGG